MRLPILALLGLAAIGGYASSSPSIGIVSTTDNDALPQQPGRLDALDPSPVVLPRSPQGIPTDPIVITTSARGTAIQPSIIYSNPPVVSSVVASSRHIITSVQGSAKPSSVAWSSQPTSQAASSHWVSSVQAPAPPSSVAWSSQPTSQAASSQSVSSVSAPAPPSSAVWSSQSTSQAASSQWAPAPSSSTAWSSQPSSQAGSSGVVPSRTASPIQGSSAAPSSGTSSAVGSSGAATTSNAWSSAWSSTAGGSVPSSGVPASSVGGSSVASSSGAWSPPGGSASPSSAWSSSVAPSSVWNSPAGSTTTAWSSGPPASSVPVLGSSVQPSGSYTTAHSSAQGSSQAGSSGLGTTSTAAGSSAAQSSGGAIPSNSPTSLQGSSTPGGTIAIPPGISSSSIPGSTPVIPPGISGSSTPGSINPPIPIGTPTSSTPGGIAPKPTGTSSSLRPLPTSTSCPKECWAFEWCKIYCEGWPFPRPIDEQPPYECLFPENIPWCHPWWFGPEDVDGSDSDPDSHSDSDPNCKPIDCVADCAAWKIATFLILKRPVCFCIPKKCDKDGDTDSSSDSDKDDPKVPKPKPTSYPKPNNPKCKLLGCGCGWMGLGYGPGCPGNDFELDVPCGIFGCSPCTFFGSCPGAKQPSSGVLGYNGYCRGAGCDPCPPELCSRPGCTIAGGCGPKPGPAPTKPSDEPDPDDCDDNQRTVITDRFVMCTEGFNVSAIPSTYWGIGGSTSSTMVTSVCLPLIDATQTICGSAQGFDTTTTKTGTNTLTSDAPACTRAPLSLDDDEGNNNPDDSLFDTSSIFASNTTMFASSISKGTSSMTSSSSSKMSSSSSASSTSSAAPAPSHTPMDRNGHWKVEISQWMWDDYSEVSWKLYDPNGFHAGEHDTRGNGLKEMTDYIQSINRPWGDSMPFGVDMAVSQPHDRDHTRINFEIKKKVSGCDYMKGVECRPYMTTEDYIESQPFALQTCEKICSVNGKHSPLGGQEDLWCDDLNKADWEGLWNGWKRHFNCGWKGFD